MNPYLVHPESFPVTPRLNFQIVPTWPPRGFGIGLANPRAALHHSCFAILIVASPGVIKSAIPAGILTVHVPAMLVQAFAWTYRGTSETLAPVWGDRRASLIRGVCASISQIISANLP